MIPVMLIPTITNQSVVVLSMAEMAVAIMVVSLPSMRGFLRRGSFFSSKKYYGSSGSHTGGYGAQTPIVTFGSSNKRARMHIDEDSGSEVELNAITRTDVIYETRRVSVQFSDKTADTDISKGKAS